MLQKPELSAGLMSLVARMQTLPFALKSNTGIAILPCHCCFRQSDASPSDLLVTCVFSSSAALRSLRFPFFGRLVFAGVDVSTGLTGDGSSVGIYRYCLQVANT